MAFNEATWKLSWGQMGLGSHRVSGPNVYLPGVSGCLKGYPESCHLSTWWGRRIKWHLGEE